MSNDKKPFTVDPSVSNAIAVDLYKLSEGVESLLNGALNRKAIVILLKETTGLGAKDINTVLDGLVGLRLHYLKAGRKAL